MTATIPDPEGDAPASALVAALLESRERWRAMIALGSDLAFETDEQGRFVVLAPEIVLGWPAERLIGTPAQALLVGAGERDAASLFDPFRASQALRRRRVWLRDADGGAACLLLSVAPIPGRPGAVRGLGIDMTEQDRHDQRLASSLLRREMTRLIARRMRRVALPFAGLAVALDELILAVDPHGAEASGSSVGALLVLHDPEAPLRVAAKAGMPWPAAIEALNDALLADCEEPPTWLGERTRRHSLCGLSVLSCSTTNHFTDRAILVLWRAEDADARPADAGWSAEPADAGWIEEPADAGWREEPADAGWSEEEAALASALLPAMQPILEHEQIQRETARLSRTDILTGLPNRQGFVAALSRRIERLDREGLPAALMVVGLDGLGPVNASAGLETGDSVLRDVTDVLRDLVRPTDLIARLGGDLFALWLDGADQFAAAERAEQLRRQGLGGGSPESRLSVSIGLAIRCSRSFEGIDSLLHRAWAAMRAVKLTGGDRWLVSAEDPTP